MPEAARGRSHERAGIEYVGRVDQDRRARIRAYKDTPRTAGVGVVRHVASGRVLLVASADIRSLLNRHLAQLRLGAHRNAALQADWNAAGAEGFAFEVIDTLPPPESPDDDVAADLATLEGLWLDKLKPYTPAGYNPPPKQKR